jgi:putative acetyltransferase
MLIAVERPVHRAAVHALHAACFPTDAEARLVDRLRADGALEVSMVALQDGRVVGHVALSAMAAPFRALGLAPLSVAPGARRRGVGDALVRDGLARALAHRWEGVFVLGDPAYYGRFGFTAEAAAPFGSPYAGPYFLFRALVPGLHVAGGRVAYASAFAALG